MEWNDLQKESCSETHSVFSLLMLVSNPLLTSAELLRDALV